MEAIFDTNDTAPKFIDPVRGEPILHQILQDLIDWNCHNVGLKPTFIIKNGKFLKQ